MSARSLPAGLILNSATGLVSGTPTTAGTSSFIVTASSSAAVAASASYSITIAAAPLPVADTSVPLAVDGGHPGGVTHGNLWMESLGGALLIAVGAGTLGLRRQRRRP